MASHSVVVQRSVRTHEEAANVWIGVGLLPLPLSLSLPLLLLLLLLLLLSFRVRFTVEKLFERGVL